MSWFVEVDSQRKFRDSSVRMEGFSLSSSDERARRVLSENPSLLTTALEQSKELSSKSIVAVYHSKLPENVVFNSSRETSTVPYFVAKEELPLAKIVASWESAQSMVGDAGSGKNTGGQVGAESDLIPTINDIIKSAV